MNALLLRLLILAGICGIGLSTLARAQPVDAAGSRGECRSTPHLPCDGAAQAATGSRS
jgi:hypothetical protein